MPCAPRRLLFAAFLAAACCSPFAALAQAAPPAEAPALRFLREGRFEELDRSLAEAQKRYEAGEIDARQLSESFLVFWRAVPELQPQFDRWVGALPQSYPAHLSRGLYLVALGWAHRGVAGARETSPVQFKEFDERIARADQDLQASLRLTAKPVESLTYLVMIARTKVSAERGAQYLQSAIELDPEAIRPRRQYLLGLRPQWGGSMDLMEQYVAQTRAAKAPAPVVHALEAEVLLYRGSLAESAGNLDQALQFAERAVELHASPSTLYEKGRIHSRRKEHELAIVELNRAIESGYDYGSVHRVRGMSKIALGRVREGLEDYVVAAERGDIWSQKELAAHYDQGRGMPKNLAAAFKWYLRAAELSDAEAQAYVGDMYYGGDGTKTSYVQAEKWLRRSAEQGNAVGMSGLAVLLWHGRGVKQDEGEAIQLWRKAAAKGYEIAQRNLVHELSTWQRITIKLSEQIDLWGEVWQPAKRLAEVLERFGMKRPSVN